MSFCLPSARLVRTVAGVLFLAGFFARPLEAIAAEERSLLIVAGWNYEALEMFPFFIDPELRQRLEAKGWEVAECRWSELTEGKAARFRVVAFLQTPNLPTEGLEENPLFQKMRRILKLRLEAGGAALVFADQFRGRIQPVLDSWLGPYGVRVAPLELSLDAQAVKRFEAYPALGWAAGARVPEGAPFGEGLGTAVPVGSELTFLLEPGPEWSPVLVGPEGGRAVASEASGMEKAAEDAAAPLVVAAARQFGEGRLMVMGSHSSFWMLNPYHEFWDRGRILESGGLAFLESALDWLEAAPGTPASGAREQRAIDDRGDRVEKPEPQTASFPEKSWRGLVGVDPAKDFSAIPVLSEAARRLGLDFLVFTPEAPLVSSREDWKRFVAACEASSRDAFRALPGVKFPSPETGNRGVAFNLKKSWDGIPWDGDSFEAFARVGVNTDWESLVVLCDPVGAPFPMENMGAVTGIEAHPESAKKFREALEGGCPLNPVAISTIRTVEDLRAAAEGWTTTIHTNRWDARDFERWRHLTAGRGGVKEFSLVADNEWEPRDWSSVRIAFRADGLPDGALATLRCGDRVLAKGAVSGGVASIDWKGIVPGWSLFHADVVNAEGEAVLLASPLAISKVAFPAFVGSDLMNGYWYPVRPTKADEADARLLGGKFGLLGTTVYPQLGWGGHFQLRSFNQLSEPLGFEIGSPPGGLPRMTAGYRWREGSSLPELAPKRSLAVNSTQAVVWRDTDSFLRRDKRSEGRRRLAVEAVPGVKSALRTTGYRWWDHAALLFEAEAEIGPSSPLFSKEGVLATLNLGDPLASFTKLEKWADGSVQELPVRAKVSLAPGEGVSAGDHPMGMVSVWALDTPLTVRFSPADSKPMLTVSQAATGESRRTATFLAVLSNHIPGKASTAADVASALYQTARWGNATAEAAPFFQKVELPNGGQSARFDQPGKVWRGSLRGLERDVEAIACWNENGAFQWQPIPPPDADGISPVLFESVPEGELFLGHPVVVAGGEALVTLAPPGAETADWTVRIQNVSNTQRELEISTHPGLKGLTAPWSVREPFAPSEVRSWPLKFGVNL